MFGERGRFVTWAESLAASSPLGDFWKPIAALACATERFDAAHIGDSVRGEPIWALALDPASAARGTVLTIAGLHAMEHIGCATARELLVRAAEPGSVWSHARVVVVPIVNVDGVSRVFEDRAAGRRRFRRKNERGVDLNRNFETSFRARSSRLASRFFAPGSGPLSEPETAAVMALFDREAPEFAVSLHAFGRWIYIPWAGSRKPSPRALELERVANAMAAAQPEPRYRVVALGQRSRFFRAYGAEIDTFHAGGALAFLLEIGPGPRLWRPQELLDPFRWYTPAPDRADPEIRSAIAAIEAIAPFIGTKTGRRLSCLP